jgi:transposase-like protein
MSKELKTPETLVDAVRYFADPDVALAFVAALRWPTGVCCPTCGSTDVRFIKTRRLWECKEAHKKRQFSVRVGTIFEDGKLPLDKWLIAIWLEANSKNSVSSYEVARHLGVTQKTAWFLQQRIRLAMQSGTFQKLTGGVEVDETYIGGKARNMHAKKRKQIVTGTGGHGSGKAVVMGLLDRHSREVRTVVVRNNDQATLQPIVRKNVAPGSALYTDALSAYTGSNAEYVHGVINHAEGYVRGEVHTNGLENFWSLFKRCIKGTHVSVEPFHLFRYLDAETFRFNNRKTDDSARFTKLVESIGGKRLTYEHLIGADDAGWRSADDADGANDLKN